MSGIAAWLESWAAAIRTRDFAAARPLFAEEVVAFGSLSEAMHGREALERDQWRPVWTRTREFRFEDWTLVCDDGHYAVVACTWSSEGDDGQDCWYERRGRATLVLRHLEDSYQCIHSHFSMMPGTQALKS